MFPALIAQRKTMADAGEGLNQAGVDVVIWVPLRDRAQPVRCSLLAVGVLTGRAAQLSSFATRFSLRSA